MEPFSFSVTEETVLWAYGILHVAYGLVTHYHSVAQVRKWNLENSSDGGTWRVSSIKMFWFFLARMTWGLPAFCISKVVCPIGNKWHMTPEQIHRFN